MRRTLLSQIVGVTLLCALTSCASWMTGDDEGTTASPQGADSWSDTAATGAGAAAPARTTAPSDQRDAGPAPTSRGGMVTVSAAYPTGNRATSAVLLEKHLPAEVTAGVPFEYRIHVENLSSLPLENVTVTDRVAGVFRVDQTQPPSSSAGGALQWNLGNLAPGGSTVIRVQGSATGEGSITSCAEVTYSSALCATIDVVAPRLEISKSGPSEVLLCDPIPYEFVVTNAGTGTVRGVVVSDELPDGLQTADGLQSFQFTVGDLGPGQSKAYQVTAQATREGSYSNSATASGQGGLSATSNTVTTRVRAPRLAISKSGTERSFIGRTITYEITVSNAGDVGVTDVVLEDRMPGGTAFVSASHGGAAGGGSVRWNLGTLAPRASTSVQLVLTARNKGFVRNTATASGRCAEAVSASAETEVTGIPAILLEVVDVDDPVEVGRETTFVITVTNQGSATATKVLVDATFESTMQGTAAGGATAGTAQGQRVDFAELPALEPGQQAQWQVRARALGEGDHRIRVTLTSDQLTRPVEETEATNLYQ